MRFSARMGAKMSAVIKRLGFYVVSIWKRMWKTPGYLAVFLLVPAVLVVLNGMTEEKTVKITAAVYLEIPETEDTDRHADGKQERGAEFIERAAKRLSGKEGTVVFAFCASEKEVEEQVAAGKAQCGYILSETLFERLKEGRYTRSIKSYEAPGTGQHTICDEVLFAALFSVYEEMTFGEQVSDFFLLEGEGKSGGPEENKKEIEERASSLFEKYRYNGSTFRFTYESDVSGIETGAGTQQKQQDFRKKEGKPEGKEETSGTAKTEEKEGMPKTAKAEEKQGMPKTEAEEKTETAEKTGNVPVRGIMALMIYICGLCGTLEVLEDEAAGRTVRFRYRKTFQTLTVCVPMFVMSFAALIVFAVSGNVDNVGTEFLKLLWYQVIMVCYSYLLKRIFKREERFLSAMPVLVLSAAVICPVFWDLSLFLPVFKILEKVYPLSYYLHL